MNEIEVGQNELRRLGLGYIPDDILKTALSISLCHREPSGCVNPDDQSCGDGCEWLQAMAEALLAERERCAKVAEEVGKGASRARDIYVMTGAAGLSRVIATAIRMSPDAALATPEE
jgi:hypothetical protein